ncbi:FHA domain-containing protein [Desulfobacterota bacterium AH_259_B03_O07]|nr:FHA domain-containing protein [Desulfobacterota bacterium AH_259_B03_O07]
MPFEIVTKRYIREARAEETRRLKVEGKIVNIGTGAGNEIQLDGLGVSINHARIEKKEDNTYELTDLGSSDETYVNNNLVSKLILIDNDEIKIGSYVLILKLPASPEEIPTILVSQIEGIEPETPEDERILKESKIKYVSRYQLSKSILNKTSLSILGLAIIVILTIYWILDDDTEAFSPGKLSDAHTQFNKDCGKCHTIAWEIVPNNACLECHEVNPHKENEHFTPVCVQCHFEHKGNPVLADLDNDSCTQCHSELLTKGYIPSSTYHRYITDFDSDHPEFAVLVRSLNQNGDTARVRLNDQKNLEDKTPIKLNHDVHLQPGLRGPNGPENLTCENCHNVDANGEYMLSIEYESHCSRCHTLEFDLRFGDEVVPHETTDIVRDFLNKSYTEYAVKNSTRLGLAGDSNALRQWVSLRVKESEDVLYRKQKCGECHILEEEALINAGLPEVVKPKIPERWFPHSSFDHELHAKNLNLSCDSCHMDVLTSESTTDVLLPSINTCIECHSSKGGAKTECVFCHQYHERNRNVTIEVTESLEEILERE